MLLILKITLINFPLVNFFFLIFLFHWEQGGPKDGYTAAASDHASAATTTPKPRTPKPQNPAPF